MDAVESCPICREAARLVWVSDTCRVKCLNRECGCEGGRGQTKTEALLKWNTRLINSTPTEEHSDVTAWRVAEAMYRGEAVREYDECAARLESLWIDEPDTATWFARAQDAITAMLSAKEGQ